MSRCTPNSSITPLPASTPIQKSTLTTAIQIHRKSSAPPALRLTPRLCNLATIPSNKNTSTAPIATISNVRIAHPVRLGERDYVGARGRLSTSPCPRPSARFLDATRRNVRRSRDPAKEQRDHCHRVDESVSQYAGPEVPSGKHVSGP